MTIESDMDHAGYVVKRRPGGEWVATLKPKSRKRVEMTKQSNQTENAKKSCLEWQRITRKLNDVNYVEGLNEND